MATGDWMRHTQAAGTLMTPEFEGPKTVRASATIGKLRGIDDPRFVVTHVRDDGETIPLPDVVERDNGVLSGFSFVIRREALGPSTLEVVVERTGPGGEPSHVFSWIVLTGPAAPTEPGREE